MDDLENLKRMKTYFDSMWQLMDRLSGDYVTNDYKRVLHEELKGVEDTILRAIAAEVMKETILQDARLDAVGTEKPPQHPRENEEY